MCINLQVQLLKSVIIVYHFFFFLKIMPCLKLGFPGGSLGKESACNVGDLGSVPGLGRSPGGGHGNLL